MHSTAALILYFIMHSLEWQPLRTGTAIPARLLPCEESNWGPDYFRFNNPAWQAAGGTLAAAQGRQRIMSSGDQHSYP